MKITNRLSAFAVLAASVLTIALTTSAQKPSPPTRYLGFVGTYTDKTQSKGIYAFDFDPATGKLALRGVAAETPNPSWVVIHPSGKYAYAANESGKQSAITAFAIDANSARLTQLNQVPALGEDPCYLSFDKTGKYLFVANYTSGNVVVFPIGDDGKLGAATANVHDEGKLGPNKSRQEGPHAHWIEQSLVDNEVYVADLGLDCVFSYAFDPTKGTLSAGPIPSSFSHRMLDRSAKLSPGTGPRHAVFSNNGMRMYVVGELQSTVTGFHMVGTDDFVPTSFQKISALPKEFSGRNDAAEIAFHPNGKFLYSSNRGHESIALFTIASGTGKLVAAGDFSAEGKEPRHFAIDPSGNYLLAEDQLSDKIVIFRINSKTGALTPTGDSAGIPAPVCIAFLPVD
jgi:6-phosphogluconolactonase